MVSGQRVRWPKPASSQAVMTCVKVSLAMSRASRLGRFMRAPVWTVTRVAPIQSAA